PLSARRCGCAQCELPPVITGKRRRASATVRVLGPRDCSTITSTSSDGIRSGVGRRPTTPQHEAGIRIDPPVSPPSATEAIPAATGAPLPPPEPPGVTPSRHGVWVAATIGLVVPVE